MVNDDGEARPERGVLHGEPSLPEVPLALGSPPPPRLLLRRPFLWLVLAETFANLGLWAFFLATAGAATYRFGASPGQLGILLASYSVAFIVVTPGIGVLADRWSPKWILVIAYGSSLLFMLTALLAPSLPWLYAAMGLFGAAHSAVWPARGALVPLLVEEERLMQANGMVGMTWQVPLIVGPALAGLLVRGWGQGAPLVFAMAVTVVAMALYQPVPDRRKDDQGGRVLAELGAGFTEAAGIPALRWLLACSVGAWLLIGVLIVLEPLLIKDLLGRGQDVFGLMLSLQGVGALLASVVLARMRGGAGRERPFIAGGLIVAGMGNLLYVGTSSVVAAGAGAVIFGLAYTFYSSPAQALIQRVARNPGRVTGAYAIVGEGGPLVTAVAIAALGGLVSVRVWLVGSAVGLSLVGLSGWGAMLRSRGARRDLAAEPDRSTTVAT